MTGSSYISSSVDITERERALDALKESEQRYRMLVDLSPEAILVTDLKHIVFANAAATRLHGCASPDDLVGREWSTLVHPDDRDGARDRFEEMKSTGRPISFQRWRRLRQDGSVVQVEAGAAPITWRGKPASLAVFRDLTNRVAAENALRESEERYRSLVEFSPDAILVQEDGVIIFANPAGAAIYGAASTDDLVGVPILDLIHPDMREEHLRRRDIIRSTGMPLLDTEHKRLRLDDSEIVVESRGIPMTWQGKQVILGVSRDITARKQAETEARLREAELRLVQRVSTMGQLSSVFAHELNQPLAAIMSYVQASRRLLLSNGSRDVGKATDLMDKAVAQTDRAGTIIRRMRGFMERRELVLEKENANEIVDEACLYALRGIGENGVNVRFDLDASGATIHVDRVQIQQVIINLVRNGIEAMEGSPRRDLTIKTSRGKDGVVIAVTDTGTGLHEDVAHRLFEPFVTTKASGMGFGLSIGRSIVEAHGGRIWSEPNRGGGTTFSLVLPFEGNSGEGIGNESDSLHR